MTPMLLLISQINRFFVILLYSKALHLLKNSSTKADLKRRLPFFKKKPFQIFFRPSKGNDKTHLLNNFSRGYLSPLGFFSFSFSKRIQTFCTPSNHASPYRTKTNVIIGNSSSIEEFFFVFLSILLERIYKT